MRFDPPQEILDRYRELVFDPHCEAIPVQIPLASITWPDEHPGAPLRAMSTLQRPSSRAFIGLVVARQLLWVDGVVPDAYQRLWREATHLLPTWPGFRRLVLSPEERALAEPAFEEAEGFFAAVAENADHVVFDSRDGLRTFEASFDPTRGRASRFARWARRLAGRRS